MCGIIGIIGKAPVTPLLLDALKRLEYRGYDSAGVATLTNGSIVRRRAQGKLASLEQLLEAEPLPGTIGIGHTRWATHGAPTENNAHPHADDRVVLVHNGIIENFLELRRQLTAKGCRFLTETDTEVVVHLISSYLGEGCTPQEAVQASLARIEGAFALAILFAGHHDLMIGARRGSPLAIGYGDGEMYLGSDALALAPLTTRISYLEEGDWVEVRADGVSIHDASGADVNRPIKMTATSGALIGKGNFPHFMLKEIYEQPTVMGDALHALLNPWNQLVAMPPFPFDLTRVTKVTIIGCGTSYHAGLVAKYWFETVARIPTEVDIASEFRYRGADMPQGGLAVFISQSGETADTLAALAYARKQGQHIISIVNVAESSMARQSDVSLLTQAGPEIGVASTKAFTTQLTVLACLVIALAARRGTIDRETEQRLCRALTEVPSRSNDVLNHDQRLAEIARQVAEARDVLYLGRGTGYPIALEGALKLKEISYIHAEGYAAGEMKHGPIALIDENMPIIVIAPSDNLFDKTASNMQEVIARGGKVIFLSDKAGIEKLGDVAAATVELPEVDPFVAPILYTIPVQLLAYHVAVLKGTDVDQPRNLAKSVTVE
ncbi:glutamine--fructose-6-phosphate transaminase (isomerizing) [Defluviicoccus vanus]|uniref:Glutamine--fructose-6-phosphate aminotransferase [isomerizing] n=1 Tax=Defluviicoccus vanus TaxID=111831 RepID=A0A7H1MYS2_9PROT|nr:glutamine--fructose-6-phosphate transaminase (isomerizing) [Defluviicoccus vanus]QNT68608.1 glutamine--fructose-6-phosphate transaminase (isomerizing) [Defluviicoccus vanus]